MNAKLTNIHKKEDEEAERTVAPVTEAEKKVVRVKTEGEKPAMLRSLRSPEGPIQRSVPADERTGGEEQEPQHGQAKVHAVSRVHAEPGQAAKHVHEERAGVN